MSRVSGRLAWVPPVLVGASAAIAAEVALGILLYGGPGLMRSLTVVLAIEGAAFAFGLWSAPAPGPELVERLRRRWLFCLVTFMIAAGFGTWWSVVQNLGGGRIGQGLGLTFLAGLPLYAAGAVIGGMVSVRMTDPAGARRGPGASVAVGAGIGFVVTGVLLPRAPIPASLLVACLVLLSAAGMVYGVVLGTRPQVHVRASRPSSAGLVRVEDRRSSQAAAPVRYLLEGAHVRRRQSLNGDAPVPWDVAVTAAMIPEDGRAWRVLSIGGGASSVPRAVLADHPTATVEVLERSEAVVELARDHFATDVEGDDGRVSLRIGNIEDLLSEVGETYDLVLVDAAALAPTGGWSGLSRSARTSLFAALGDGGVLALGPLVPEPSLGEPPDAWEHTVLHRRQPDADEVLVLALRAGAHGPLPNIPDFVATHGGTPAQ